MYAPIQYGISGIIIILIDQSKFSELEIHRHRRVIDEETMFLNKLLHHIMWFYNYRTEVYVIGYGNPSSKIIFNGAALNPTGRRFDYKDSELAIGEALSNESLIDIECSNNEPDMTSAYLLAKKILFDYLCKEYAVCMADKSDPNFAIPQIINITTGFNCERMDTLEFIIGQMNAIASNFVFKPFDSDTNSTLTSRCNVPLSNRLDPICQNLSTNISHSVDLREISSVRTYKNILCGVSSDENKMIFINLQRQKWESIIEGLLPGEFPGCCALSVSYGDNNEDSFDIFD